MKKKNILLTIGVILLLGLILTGVWFIFIRQAIIPMTTPWVNQESFATWGGVWSSQYPVTNAYDENWGTPTALSGTYQEANIYEYSILDYPQDALVDYIEFQVRYSVAPVPITDGYASIKYYAWNYQTSSWDKVYEDSEKTSEYGLPLTTTFTASALDHLKNNQVRLRTHATIGFLSSVWVYESQVRLSYSLDVGCDLGETKCEGADNKEYFTCENYEWVNQGFTIGKCNVECISQTDCQADYKCENSECVLDTQTYYRFSDNQCSPISLLPSEKTTNDYNTLTECEENIVGEPDKIDVYRFLNNQCILINIFPSEKTSDDYDTLQGCEAQITDEEPIEPNYLLIISIAVGILFIIILAVVLIRRKK